MSSSFRISLVLAFTVWNLNYAIGQVVIGEVLNAVDRTAVPHAAVGLLKYGVGTTTNLRGQFSVEVSQFNDSDTITVSSLGYYNASATIAELKENSTIYLKPAVFQLNEVVIKPLLPEDYIERIVKAIPKNYPDSSFGLQMYYNERFSENGIYIKYNECICVASLPHFTDTSSLIEIYSTNGRSFSGNQIQFLLDKREKAHQKELKKAKKSGDSISSTLPEMVNLDGLFYSMMKYDFVKYTQYLDPEDKENKQHFLFPANFKYYDYKLLGASMYNNQAVLHIGFDQKDNVNEALLQGNIYFDPNTYAVVALEYSLSKKGIKHLVPGYAKAAMFVLGYDLDAPTFSGFNTYQPINGKWYLKAAQFTLGANIEKRNFFSENELAKFRGVAEMVVNEVYPSTLNLKMPSNAIKLKANEPLEKQLINTNPDFWETQRVARPSGFK